MLEWVEEVMSDPILICPDDIWAEAEANLWVFSLSREQLAAISASDVACFAARVIEGRRAQLVRGGHPPMTMYWWHDEQAGQLRFSMISENHGELPFGCTFVSVSSFDYVAQVWLKSSQRFIPWEDLEPAAFDSLDDAELSPYVLPVWSIQLP